MMHRPSRFAVRRRPWRSSWSATLGAVLALLGHGLSASGLAANGWQQGQQCYNLHEPCADGSMLTGYNNPPWRRGPPRGDFAASRTGPAACRKPGDRCPDGSLWAGPSPERAGHDLFFAPCPFGQRFQQGQCQGVADLALWRSDIVLPRWHGIRRAIEPRARVPLDARIACQSLDAAGHRDWRLPTYMEVRTPSLYALMARRLWVAFIAPGPSLCGYGEICPEFGRLTAALARYRACRGGETDPDAGWWDRPLPGLALGACRRPLAARCLGEVCPDTPIYWFQLGTAGPPPLESLIRGHPGPWAFSPYDPRGETVQHMFATRAAAILCVRDQPMAEQ